MVVISAVRRGLAALVLVLAGIASVDAALFKVWHPVWDSPKAITPEQLQGLHIDCTRSVCYSTSPGWTIPVAIVVALLGILVAALIYRPRSRPPTSSEQATILRGAERRAAANT
jgi:hypothetical protein